MYEQSKQTLATDAKKKKKKKVQHSSRPSIISASHSLVAEYNIFFFPVLLAAIGWDKQGIDEMAVDKSFSISVYPQLRRGNLSIRHTGLM